MLSIALNGFTDIWSHSEDKPSQCQLGEECLSVISLSNPPALSAGPSFPASLIALCGRSEEPGSNRKATATDLSIVDTQPAGYYREVVSLHSAVSTGIASVEPLYPAVIERWTDYAS